MRLNDILDTVGNYANNADLDVMRAYVFSAKAHAGQVRKSGEPHHSSARRGRSCPTGRWTSTPSRPVCCTTPWKTAWSPRATAGPLRR